MQIIAAERDPALQADLIEAGTRVSWLLRYRGTASNVATFFIRLHETYPELREPLRKCIADVLLHDRDSLAPERVEMLDRLHTRFEDASLRGQLLQYVGPHEWERETQSDYASIAADLLADMQVLAGQWPWLTSGQAGAAWELGKALAAADPGGRLAGQLAKLPGGGPDQRIVCGYVAARRSTLGDAWYEPWVMALFDHEPQPAALLLEIIWRCGATDGLVGKTAKMLRSRKPSSAAVGQLKYAGWQDTGDAALETLLRAMMESGYRETAVSILPRRMQSAATKIERWRQLAMDLVLDLDLIRCKEMPNHYWYLLAKIVVPYHPREIATAIFRAHGQRDNSEAWLLRYKREVVDVLLSCIEHAPHEAWDTLRSYLWPPRKAVLFSIGFPLQVLERLPPDAVLEWIAGPPADQSARRAALLAPLTNARSLSDGSLAARIIALYGNDEDVDSAFFNHYVSGAFRGTRSSRSREMANNLSSIAKQTALPGLRAWAARSANALHTLAASEQQAEEERSLLIR